MKRDAKRLKFGANSLVMTLLVIGILIFVELISYNNSKQFDLTKEQKYTLTKQSLKVLSKFNGPVKAYAFFVEGNQLKPAYRDELELYKRAGKNFDYEFIDPNKKPGMAEKYQISFNGETVFEYAGRQQRIRDVTEEAVTNVLIKLANEKQKKVYFTTGHGEKALESTDEPGLSLLKRYVENEGYAVEEIKLYERVEMPKDTSALAIVGPQSDLYPQEMELLQKYAAQGGSVLIFIDPEKAEALTDFIRKAGMEPGNDIIVDKLSKMLGGDYFTPIIGGFGEHEITKDFGNTLQFSVSRSVTKGKEVPVGSKVSELCYTGPSAWGETDLKRLREQSQVEMEKDDVPGPVSLGSVAQITSPEKIFGGEALKGETRIAVFGNSDFVANAMIGIGGNLNFILNTVNWLLADESQISIERAVDTTSSDVIVLTSAEATIVLMLSIFLIPLLALVIGVRVFIKRKNMQ